jgi:hypothetical protein
MFKKFHAFCYNFFWIFKKLTRSEFHSKWWQIFFVHIHGLGFLDTLAHFVRISV